MKTRRIVSLTLTLSFVVMVYTGIMLFLCPHGRVAYWTGWTMWGFSKDQYGQLHTTFMLMFLVTGIWHFVLNWKPFTTYLKTHSRQLRIFTPEFNVALLLVVLFAVGTLAGMAPWSSLLDWEGSIKDYWEHRDGSPPWGHAEENTLARFTRGLVSWEQLEHGRSVRLSIADAVQALRAAGLTVESEKQRLVDISRANHTTPQALMSILLEAAQPEEGAVSSDAGRFPMPFSGLGRMSVRDYCQKYDLQVDSLLALLPRGVKIEEDHTFREIANELRTDPEGVIEILNEAARPE